MRTHAAETDRFVQATWPGLVLILLLVLSPPALAGNKVVSAFYMDRVFLVLER